jgi:hypothetical protein
MKQNNVAFIGATWCGVFVLKQLTERVRPLINPLG